MAGFFKKKKAPAPQQPHPGWPWSLCVSGYLTTAFDWEDVAHFLEGLAPGGYLILEQKDPKDPERYWFLQSAIVPGGPRPGDCVVGCGYSSDRGPVLLERYVSAPRDAIPLFSAAFLDGTLELSAFEDHTHWLPEKP